ncbi:MAG TPA: STAS domain-containing protein [Solirubrobacteraceae bacterium]
MSTESPNAQFLRESPFTCTVHRRADASEIQLGGELDLAAKPTLEEALTTALEPGPVKRVMVDFAAVTFADSTTLTWLLRADVRVQASGGRLIAVVGPGRVRDLLRLTGVDDRLTVVAGSRRR